MYRKSDDNIRPRIASLGCKQRAKRTLYVIVIDDEYLFIYLFVSCLLKSSTLIHPVSKTHWATHTSTPAFSVDSEQLRDTSQVMPMLFKSCCMVYIQFFRGLPGFLFELLKWFLVYSLYVLAVVHSQNVPEPSQSSLFYDEIYLLQMCLQ